MDLDVAKQLLSTCVKYESRDHAFGDMEVYWYDGDTVVADGYFSGSIREVSLNDGVFLGEQADQLLKCFADEKVQRNDSTGPDDFEVGKVMPGLTKEGVRKELTGE